MVAADHIKRSIVQKHPLKWNKILMLSSKYFQIPTTTWRLVSCYAEDKNKTVLQWFAITTALFRRVSVSPGRTSSNRRFLFYIYGLLHVVYYVRVGTSFSFLLYQLLWCWLSFLAFLRLSIHLRFAGERSSSAALAVSCLWYFGKWRSSLFGNRCQICSAET